MNIESFRAAVEKFGHKAQFATTGRDDWTRIFILDKNGVTIGRGSFYEGELSNLKQYRPSLFSGLIDSDSFFLRLELYLKTGKLVSEAEYDQIIQIAEQKSKDDLLAKQQLRATLPKKKRPRLQGRGLYRIVVELLNA